VYRCRTPIRRVIVAGRSSYFAQSASLRRASASLSAVTSQGAEVEPQVGFIRRLQRDRNAPAGRPRLMIDRGNFQTRFEVKENG